MPKTTFFVIGLSWPGPHSSPNLTPGARWPRNSRQCFPGKGLTKIGREAALAHRASALRAEDLACVGGSWKRRAMPAQDQSEIEPGMPRLDSAFYDAMGYAARRIVALGWAARRNSPGSSGNSGSSVDSSGGLGRSHNSESARSRANKASCIVAYDMVFPPVESHGSSRLFSCRSLRLP